jgi:hypothetical protein
MNLQENIDRIRKVMGLDEILNAVGYSEEAISNWLTSFTTKKNEGLIVEVKIPLIDLGFPYKIFRDVDTVFKRYHVVTFDKDNGTPILVLKLMDVNDDLRIMGIVSSENARGKGYALRLYSAIPKIFNRPLLSDIGQNVDSKKVWVRLYNLHPDRLSVIDMGTKIEYQPIYKDDTFYITYNDEEIPIYGEDKRNLILKLKP